jgi:hypothetical protein
LSANLAARVFLVLFGCIGVAWGTIAFPVLKRDAAVGELAARIARGDAFAPQQLLGQTGVLAAIENESYCDADALRSDAIVRLRIVDSALAAADTARLDRDIADAKATLTKALSCAPTDSYFWLSMFWLKSLSEGFKPADLALLRMSYRQGPNEGWVMTARNHLALAMFPSLPPDLAERALKEFARLLEPEFVAVAVDNFTGPGWPMRERLLNEI